MLTKAMASPPLLRRFCCSIAAPSSSSSSSSHIKKQLVFMGSPQVSASVLDALFDASKEPNSSFQLAAIVTQPPSARGRGRNLMPSPVAQRALDQGFPDGLIFTPQRAKEEGFLSAMKALNPDVCVTAAYGNILPNKFLEIPLNGTINVHPSLLPLYRGAAPVQRALQDGVTETGVSLVYTVKALDAGPVIASEKIEVDDQIKAPALLAMLFERGSELLIHELPSIFNGSARLKAKEQDDSKATLAPKLKSEESWLSFDEEASVIHNKVRAFAGWPGTRTKIQLLDGNGQSITLELKIITTRVRRPDSSIGSEDEILFEKGALLFPCSEFTAVEVLEVQLPGKKVTTAQAFWNGLQGRKLKKIA